MLNHLMELIQHYFQYFQNLINSGRLYIAISPLYGYKTHVNSKIEKFFFLIINISFNN